MSTPRIPPLALVFAAGSARRFGSDKRRAPLPGGRTLLETVIANIEDAGLAALPVFRLGDDDSWWSRFTTGLPVADAVAAQGLGSSIAAAAAIAPAGRDLLICLGDMPYVESSTYAALAQAAAADAIVCPVYRGRRGNPVLFGANYRGELLKLSGERGARILLERFRGAVIEITVDDPGIHRDIDRPEDLGSEPQRS